MLVLSRHAGEKIKIGDDVTLVVVELRGDKVRLGIEAERSVKILRHELDERVADRLETLAARGKRITYADGGDKTEVRVGRVIESIEIPWWLASKSGLTGK